MICCIFSIGMKGVRRETHYFDWRWNHCINESNITNHYQSYCNYYNMKLLNQYESLFTGESTPSYILHR